MWLSGGGCGWKLLVWLVGVSSYNLYIPTALVSVLFCSSIPTSFFILLKCFFVLVYVIFVQFYKKQL